MSIVLFQFNLSNSEILLIQEEEIIIGLLITIFIFLVLLILGMRKTYKLNAENERLANLDYLESDEKEQKYKDFTEGHLYNNN
ncbi:hypothetical protein [Formosa algae]|uniref:Membrane-bound spermidine synthase n=1 Tax=Formosa algae TaxID=225843 RepID=A0A9X1CDB9_9FLAO|nr:hypothetical protein [Formosa algae]MBP1841069.1 putative membrane-bound spermidine synthase [Formosa algae]MDQ0336511.1 putative membrane-bound spermidine synthase [Formosa algae]OEI81469.1 hypothetical protein AST99_04325 [Formosa algae]PNW26068.1 hypothetical protein BKP44_18275 [Formosa algae]